MFKKILIILGGLILVAIISSILKTFPFISNQAATGISFFSSVNNIFYKTYYLVFQTFNY
jgi:cell shape-determining protein MreC